MELAGLRDRAVFGGRSRSLSGINLCSVLNRCGVHPSQIRGGTQIARPWPSLRPRRLWGSFRTVTFSEGDQPQRHGERGDWRSEMGDRGSTAGADLVDDSAAQLANEAIEGAFNERTQQLPEQRCHRRDETGPKRAV